MRFERIVVVCEGPSDEQVIPILLKRFVEEQGGSVGEVVTYQMKSFRARTFEKKVLAVLNRESSDHVLIVVDRDKDSGRLSELQAGREKARDPQRCVIGLAVEMLEAWLLADQRAWSTVFPNAGKIELPKRPEASWGDKNSQNHPKRQLQAAFEACHVVDANKVFYFRGELTKAIDLARLAESCPNGFGR
jgi:hypothetical protein